MSLTIGMNAAVFAILNEVALRPPPFQDHHELFVAWGADSLEVRPGLDGRRLVGASFAHITALDVFQLTPRPVTVGKDGPTVQALLVGRHFLDVLGVATTLGPGFSSDGEFEAIVSETVWRNHFDGDSDVLKRQLFVDGRPFAVKGVLPATFAFPDYQIGAWLLLPETSPGLHQVQIVGRQRSEATRQQVRAELASLFREGAESDIRAVGVFNVATLLSGEQLRAAWALYGVATLILMAGCVTAAGLLFHDAIGRSREWALMISVGAQRKHLIGDRFRYCTILGTTAAVFGIVLAGVALSWIREQDLADIPQIHYLRINSAVIAYTALIAVTAAAIAAIGPAVMVSRLQPFLMLRVGAAATAGRFETWLRGGLLSTLTALTLVIICVSFVLGKSLVSLLSVDWGFVQKNVVVSEITTDLSSLVVRPLAEVFDDSPLRAVRSVPSVESAAMAYGVPLRWLRWQPTQVRVDSKVVSAGVWTVTEDYFRTLGVRVSKGREFASTDDLRAHRVCIVSRRFARVAWPNSSSIGKTVSLLKLKDSFRGQPRDQVLAAMGRDPSVLEPDGEGWTVVGEVDEVRMFGLRDTTGPVVYLSMRQSPETPNAKAIVVAKMRDVAELTPIVSALKTASKSSVTGFRIESSFRLSDEFDKVSGARGSARLLTYTAFLFAGVATVLTGIGIYTVAALNILKRKRELSVRYALGATHFAIAATATKGVVLPVLVGVLVGLPAAMVAVAAIRGLVYGVRPNDPLVMTVGAVAIGAVASVAAAAPIVRALRINGADLLRVE